jgi:hypothetical protein
MRSLTEAGAFSFYYVSHAPFLFAFSTLTALQEIRAQLLYIGIPAMRLEMCNY